MAKWPSYSLTRFEPLGLSEIGPGLWRFVDYSDGRESNPACVGPQYRTKAEAMGDLSRYARESWGLGPPTIEEKRLAALKVIAMSAATVAWLAENDPMALAQVWDAIGDGMA